MFCNYDIFPNSLILTRAMIHKDVVYVCIKGLVFFCVLDLILSEIESHSLN